MLRAAISSVATRKLPDGTLWRSIVTEEKSRPAETLADYRGNYNYNLLDENLRAFNAAVPTMALWDNQEVMGASLCRLPAAESGGYCCILVTPA